MVRRICGFGLALLCILPFAAPFATLSLTNSPLIPGAVATASGTTPPQPQIETAPWQSTS
jgi:hypothetical protein